MTQPPPPPPESSGYSNIPPPPGENRHNGNPESHGSAQPPQPPSDPQPPPADPEPPQKNPKGLIITLFIVLGVAVIGLVILLILLLGSSDDSSDDSSESATSESSPSASEDDNSEESESDDESDEGLGEDDDDSEGFPDDSDEESSDDDSSSDDYNYDPLSEADVEELAIGDSAPLLTVEGEVGQFTVTEIVPGWEPEGEVAQFCDEPESDKQYVAVKVDAQISSDANDEAVLTNDLFFFDSSNGEVGWVNGPGGSLCFDDEALPVGLEPGSEASGWVIGEAETDAALLGYTPFSDNDKAYVWEVQ